MVDVLSKVHQRGIRSRALILDSAQQLMATRGYAGTSISAICQDTGLPPTSIYHHFGNKQQLLAEVMQRGAQRWFASLPDWDEQNRTPGSDISAVREIAVGAADAVADNPLFLRLFYMLCLEGQTDSSAAQLVADVRTRAFEYFEPLIVHLLEADYPPDVARAAATRLTSFAVALSDGCFFSLQLESERAGIRQMYTDLVVAVRAMAPHIIDTLDAAPPS